MSSLKKPLTNEQQRLRDTLLVRGTQHDKEIIQWIRAHAEKKFAARKP